MVVEIHINRGCGFFERQHPIADTYHCGACIGLQVSFLGKVIDEHSKLYDDSQRIQKALKFAAETKGMRFQETWAVVKQHISPLAVSQMHCLRRICGISLRNHVPNVDILNRCNTLSVEPQLQGKRLR